MLNKLQEQIRFAISRWQVILYDGLMVVIAWFLAYWFRFNLDTIPQHFLDQAIAMLPLVALIHVGMFIGFGVHRGAWRITSAPDVSAIVKSVFFGTALIAVVIFVVARLIYVPRSVFPLEAVLLIGLLITSRLVYRAYHERMARSGSLERVLIVGAGVAGEMLAKDLRIANSVLYEPVAFLDDDPNKHGREIEGIQVLLHIELVLIAIPSATEEDMQQLVNYCEQAQVSYRTLPKVQDILDGTARSRDLRPVTLDDLLGRDETNQGNE